MGLVGSRRATQLMCAVGGRGEARRVLMSACAFARRARGSGLGLAADNARRAVESSGFARAARAGFSSSLAPDGGARCFNVLSCSFVPPTLLCFYRLHYGQHAMPRSLSVLASVLALIELWTAPCLRCFLVMHPPLYRMRHPYP